MTNRALQSQLDWLDQDIRETNRVISAHIEAVADVLADFTDSTVNNYNSIVIDLSWRVLYHSLGMVELLRNELLDPAVVVQRAVWETLVTISYLTKHANSHQEALVYRAYSHLKQMRLFPAQDNIVQERQQILEIMPDKAVEEAQRRISMRPWTWSGKSLRQMAAESDVAGYETGYDFMSAEAHSAVVGGRVRVVKREADGLADISLGRAMSDKDIQSHANFTRRALKHAFRIMWGTIGGPKVSIQSPDPDLWMSEDETEPNE